MAVSNPDVLRGFHNAVKAMGEKSVNSDAWFEIEGAEEIGLLTKQFPFPMLTPGGEIEVAGPVGMGMWQAQQLKTHLQGQMTFEETVTGMVQRFLQSRTGPGVYFDATVYEGTPQAYYRAYKIRNCFFQADLPDRDWENRSAITLVSGTLFFHFFGEVLPGTIVA